MKNRNMILAVLLLCGAGSATAFLVANSTWITGKKVSTLYSAAELHKMSAANPEREMKERQAFKEAEAYARLLRATDPATGYIDPQKVLDARSKVAALRYQRGSGPLGLQWQSLGPDNVGGRTRAILVDKDSSNLMYAGGVSGGLWVSHDGALSWQPHPIDTAYGNHCVSSIIQTPGGDIYFGTGEGYNISGGDPPDFAFMGGGIYKSSDDGATFSVLPSTLPAVANSTSVAWAYINALAYLPANANGGSNPETIYAGVSSGLYSSTDGGNTWNLVSGIANDASGGCSAVVVGSNGSVHAAINLNYYHSDDGVNFSTDPTSGFPVNDRSQVALAVSPQDPNYVYASVANTDGGMLGVFQSTDNGTSWQPYSPLNSTLFNPLGNQGSYDDVIAVAPGNKEKVYVGGQTDMWAGGSSVGWTQLSYGYLNQPNPYYVHVDFHALTFDPKDSNILYTGTDGGIGKTLNATASQPSFTSRNKGYDVTQFYGMDAAVNGEVMAGSQDNGTSYINFQGNTPQTANIVSGGDGGPCIISKTNPNALFVTEDGSMQRSSDKGASFGGYFDNYIQTLAPYIPFFPAYALWETTDTGVGGTYVYPSVFMIGTGGYAIFTLQNLDFSTTPVWYSISIETGFYATAVSKTSDGNMYVGTYDGHLYFISGFQTAKYTPAKNEVSGLTVTKLGTPGGNRYVTSIGVDPNDTGHIVVTYAGYGADHNVYESFNGASAGATFRSIQGALPPMPVYSAVISYYDPGTIIVGTDMGIWATTGDDSTAWGEEDQGLSSVPVYWLDQTYVNDTSCQILYASSFGRGMFRTTTLNPTPSCYETTLGINSTALVNKLSVYPNPATDQTILEMDLAQSAAVNVRVVDMLGRIYLNKSYGPLSGSQQLHLDVSGLAPGNYLVSVQAGDTYTAKPIVVIR